MCQNAEVFSVFCVLVREAISILNSSREIKCALKTGMAPRRTRKRTPPDPGPQVCSPLAARRSKSSCLPSSIVQKVAAKTLRRTKGGGDTKKQLAKELGCKEDDERCIVEKSYLSHKEKKHILDAYFRPVMPDGWKSDPDMWLNSDDIAKVMRQYEKAYPDFRFLGVVPIDFSAPDPYAQGTQKKCMNDQFCHVDLKEEKQKGRRILGAIFNLDPHYKGGSHWVALAIDLKRGCSYYFDSYGMPPPEQVARFMRYLTLQDPSLRLESNGRRFQYSDSECGMYSMYFLIRMIAGESFKKFCKKAIPDKYMYKFRKILFDPRLR